MRKRTPAPAPAPGLIVLTELFGSPAWIAPADVRAIVPLWRSPGAGATTALHLARGAVVVVLGESAEIAARLGAAR